MRGKKLIPTVLLAAAAASVMGCMGEAVIAGPPPAARVEVRGIAPGPGYLWIDGHWGWRGDWVWMGGRWALPPRGRHAWVRGHWVRHGRGWVYHDGHWR
jgi:hypothetical protein